MHEVKTSMQERGVNIKTAAEPSNQFSNILGSAINELNNVVITSENKMDAYTRGEEKDLVSVMVSMNDARLGLTMATELRNRFIDFYQEISKLSV